MSLGSILNRVVAEPRSWFRAVVRRTRIEDEMHAELAHHLDLLTADLIRAGHAPEEAARRARIALGTQITHKENMRASLGLRWWDELRADLRYGVRILRKSAGFTAIAAASLALAIGANTTIFSVAKSLLYDRLNVPDASELRMLRWYGDQHRAVHSIWGDFGPAPGGAFTSSAFSYPIYRHMREHNHSMQDLLAYGEDSMNATIRGNARRADVTMVSGNYYAVLGIRAQLGRTIQQSDDAVPGAGAVAVISDSLWEREYARSPSVLGAVINVNQSFFTIVGVNPPGFTGAKNVQMSPDIFVPLSMQPLIDPKGEKLSLLEDAGRWWLVVLGRKKPSASDPQARAELNVELAAAVRGLMPLKAGETIPWLGLVDGSRGLGYAADLYGRPVYVLIALTGFVLLLACANIANMLLARGAQRQREMSVRLALGAGRGRVMRQLLTESLLLSVIGGTGGLVVGYFSRNVLPGLLSNAWEPTRVNVPFGWGVFCFSAGITLLTGLIFGLTPAWIAARTEMSSSLKESVQTASRRRKGLGGKALVGFQIALSTMLVLGAGLFLRTLIALNTVDVGFRTDHLLLFEISPPVKRYGPGKDVQLHQGLEAQFASLPGVQGVALGWTPYIANNTNSYDFLPEGEKEVAGQDQGEDVNAVNTTFFQTMGIRMVSGRSFGIQDTATSEKVGILNEALARKRFPHVSALGKRFKTGDVWYRIIGISADTRYSNLRDAPPAQFFLLYTQQSEVGGMTYAIRTRSEGAELVPALRDVVQRVDRDLPMVDVRTQREQIEANMQVERMFATLTVGFCVLALALACVGIYGIMAYSVANRRNEIGIRLALGAQPGQVRGMILRESTWLAVAGVIAGVAVGLILTRLVKTMLYGIEPYDPVTMAGGVFILLGVALAASWIPARRASRVQPMEALRHE